MAKKIWGLAALSIVFFSCSSAPVAPSASATGGFLAEANGFSAREAAAENENRMVAYSVLLTLTVKNPEEARKTLAGQVKNHNGFIVNESEDRFITRIPVENMDDFVNSAKTLGKTVDEKKIGTDITDQYRDNIIRLESLKKVRDRYLALLEKANAVNDMLSIEREIERINTQIETLEGKIQHAESSVAYSNITIYFGEKTKPGPLGWMFYGLYRGIKWLFVWN